ncbi:MAG: helix-turn-helix transcriptional regulator [Rhodobacteraceae bacterium]|nr:MAG: helix-turn-helix transcriptional regulator [Paracoccaceae bacterium]
MLSPQDSALLCTIFSAGAGQRAWPEVLTAVCADWQASAALLVTPDGIWAQDGASELVWPEGFAGLRLGRVYTGEELEARGLSRGGWADQRAIGMPVGTEVAWLVLSRARGSFRAVDSARLSAFAAPLAQALSLSQHMQSLAARARRAERMARRLGVGAVDLDAQGRCIAADATAQDLLAQAGLALSQLGVVGAGVQQVGDRLELVQTPHGVFLRDTGLILPDARVIAQALGISLPEARLARALGMGDTLAQAATRLGLTLETARAYSKQIFAKTGLKGQPALMRRLWTSALILR